MEFITEDVFFAPNTMLTAQPDSSTDFDYMDDLLYNGCWLETTDGSEFLKPSSPPPFTPPFDPTFIWPTLDINNDHIWTTDQTITTKKDENQMFSSDTDRKSLINPKHLNHNTVNDEPSRRLWIGPNANSSVTERLLHALESVKDFAREKDVLIQLWVPVNRGGRRVLVTNDQPFKLDCNCIRLANYREISLKYQFSADGVGLGDSKDVVGLPGRVFLSKVPEWTPDVRFFRSEEYPRVDHAQKFDVRGTLALPVFEQSSKTCLGVMEVVMTTQLVKHHRELENVCKALEAVNLRSSEIPTIQKSMAYDNSYRVALPEIQSLLKRASETHRLPLVQTWVSCTQQGKTGSRHSNDNYIHCVSTVDDIYYVSDPRIRGFHEACSDHHLLKGQGVAGAAFQTNQPCFSDDITNFKNTEYPLAHHARIFGLGAAVAIRLRCIHTGSADFVLEFFLPVDCREPEEQRKMLSSLSVIIQHVSRTLRVVTDKEVEEVVIDSASCEVEKKDMEEVRSEKCCGKSGSVDSLLQNKRARPWLGDETWRGSFDSREEDSCLEDSSFSNVTTVNGRDKRRSKTEKTIDLQVLQQYFAGSLKNAANSIGVCPTTLKRICRQHGIKRWPSRKIKKVGHSLEKIQRVIDSVQGVSGGIKIGSFYSNFPELVSPPNTSLTTTLIPNTHPNRSNIQPEGLSVSSQHVPTARSTSSSCSPSSSSSQCCSTRTQQQQQQPLKVNYVDSIDPVDPNDRTVVCNNGVVKRVRSDAAILPSGQIEPKLLSSSQTHDVLNQPLTKPVLTREVDCRRVKVTYGDEKVRFRMVNEWGLRDLSKEIATRFSIDDMNSFDLKYMDDDSEWVLLTCDDDLEECLDVCQKSNNHTIKILLQVSRRISERCSESSDLS